MLPTTAPTVSVSHTDLQPGLELARLLADATRADRHPPFGEHVLLTLDGRRQQEHAAIAVHGDDGLDGFCVLSRTPTAWYADLVVAPAVRGRGIGTRLLTAARDHAASHGGGLLRVWSHSQGAPDALAARLGMTVARSVSYQRRSLDLVPESSPPAGARLRTLRPDETAAWLALSNSAFDGHPENGGWSPDDLAWRLAASWSDLARFVVLTNSRTNQLLAGVWTKVESGSDEGELYVVAVHPEHVGKGLGKVVVAEAMRVLARQGLATASLYVDSNNHRAVALYAAAGFVEQHVDRCFAVTV